MLLHANVLSVYSKSNENCFILLCLSGIHVLLSISFNLRYSPIQVGEDARICVFGRHVSEPNRCSVMILNSKGEEKVIADTDHRDFGAVACLNGEFAMFFH